jgi:hypothetical protein
MARAAPHAYRRWQGATACRIATAPTQMPVGVPGAGTHWALGGQRSHDPGVAVGIAGHNGVRLRKVIATSGRSSGRGCFVTWKAESTAGGALTG